MKIEYSILTIVVALVLGFIKIIRGYKKVVADIDFANEYRGKFLDITSQYFSSSNRKFDYNLYEWLTLNANKMQTNLGSMGTMEYVAPFQRFTVSNYSIILNSIPKFRLGDIENFDVSHVDDCILRYIGYKGEVLSIASITLKNPLIWLREGLKEIIAFPISTLSLFGFISTDTVRTIRKNRLYDFISNIVAMIAFLSSLITIFAGWDQSISFLKNLFK